MRRQRVVIDWLDVTERANDAQQPHQFFRGQVFDAAHHGTHHEAGIRRHDRAGLERIAPAAVRPRLRCAAVSDSPQYAHFVRLNFGTMVHPLFPRFFVQAVRLVNDEAEPVRFGVWQQRGAVRHKLEIVKDGHVPLAKFGI